MNAFSFFPSLSIFAARHLPCNLRSRNAAVFFTSGAGHADQAVTRANFRNPIWSWTLIGCVMITAFFIVHFLKPRMTGRFVLLAGVDIRSIEPPEKGFFSKRLDFDGIPIKAHATVSDEALVAAYERLNLLLGGLGGYRTLVMSNLAKARVELHIIGRDQVTTDLPEWQHDKGKPLAEYGGLTRDQRTRGMGGRLVSCGEENLLRLPIDRYRGRDICIHEFAHALRNYGVTPGMRTRLNGQYQRSLKKGRWKGSYAASNPDEFFAELSMWYFGTHGDMGMTGAKPKSGKEGLRTYDPDAYSVIDEFYTGRAEIH